MVFLRGIGTVLMGMQNEFYGGRGQVVRDICLNQGIGGGDS